MPRVDTPAKMKNNNDWAPTNYNSSKNLSKCYVETMANNKKIRRLEKKATERKGAAKQIFNYFMA